MPAFLTKETAKIWTDKELSYAEREQALIPVDDDFLYAQEIKDVKDELEVNGAISIC
jgi:putative SOS response-associated peptidase YedK